MSITVHSTEFGQITLSNVPSICPYCHTSIAAIPLYAYINQTSLEVFCNCTKIGCLKTFVGYYNFSRNSHHGFYLDRNSIGSIEERLFSEIIQNISSQFCLIYNQSLAAEDYELNEICGVGYRKALEYLIKDYAVLNNPDDKQIIEKQTLASTIATYVSDTKLKSVSKRAAWLGNDETHYVRKWEEKSLKDLKMLIDLTLHWIEAEELTKRLKDDMPE